MNTVEDISVQLRALTAENATGEALDRLLRSLHVTLEDFLSAKIRIDEKVVYPSEYGTVYFHASRIGGPLALQIKGHFMVHLFEGKVWVYAIMLAFSGNDRLGLQLYGGNSILTAIFGYGESGPLGWSAPTWEPDESGEWESYKSFAEESRISKWPTTGTVNHFAVRLNSIFESQVPSFPMRKPFDVVAEGLWTKIVGATGLRLNR